MNVTRIHTSIRLLLASAAVAATVLAIPAAATTDAAGLRNCVDITGRQFNRVGCWEAVWSDGAEYRMTFSNTQYAGAIKGDEDAFYVLAPQGATAQGALPFAHDHVVRDLPAHNGGEYSVRLHGWFLLCSADGISSGACVPTMSEVEGVGTLPLAKSADGQALTSAARIEAAVAAGNVVLIDTGAVLVGSITAGH